MNVIAAVKAGDVPALERLLAREPELAGASEDGISAVRLALYHRQPAALEALLAAQPPLDGLDLAALGWTEDLHRALAADPELVSRRSRRRLHGAALRRASSAARPRPACCSTPAPIRTPWPTTTRACARSTPPPRRATPRSARLLLDGGRRPGRAPGGRLHRAARGRAARRRGARRRAAARTAPTRRCAPTTAPTPRGSRGANATAVERAARRVLAAASSRRSGPCRSSARGPARARRSRAA